MLNALVLVSPLLVGIVFLATGIVKALEPRLFMSHLSRLGSGLFPPKLLVPATIAFTIIECALGAALILRLFPSYLFPTTLLLLLILSVITIWGNTTGRTEDCGCYTGLLEVNPQQSIALNCLYGLLLTLALFHPITDFLTPTQQVITLSIGLLVSVTLTTGSYYYYWRKNKPILDLLLIKINQPWKPEWFADYEGDWKSGSKLAVFLSPKCKICKLWLPVLKVIHQRPNLPDVVGGVVGTKEEIQEFLLDRNLPFPVVAVQPSLASRLVDGFPCAIVLENGIVKDKWVGAMPREFVNQVVVSRRC